MTQSVALLLVILALGVFGRNLLVMAAAAVAIALALIQWHPALVFVEQRGIAIGLTFLTLAVLAPVALGKINIINIVGPLWSLEGGVAVAGGILAAWVCARGVELLKADPAIFLGLTLGSILGASFFRGIPVGPLFAAGLAYVLFKLMGR